MPQYIFIGGSAHGRVERVHQMRVGDRYKVIVASTFGGYTTEQYTLREYALKGAPSRIMVYLVASHLDPRQAEKVIDEFESSGREGMQPLR